MSVGRSGTLRQGPTADRPKLMISQEFRTLIPHHGGTNKYNKSDRGPY